MTRLENFKMRKEKENKWKNMNPNYLLTTFDCLSCGDTYYCQPTKAKDLKEKLCHVCICEGYGY